MTLGNMCLMIVTVIVIITGALMALLVGLVLPREFLDEYHMEGIDYHHDQRSIDITQDLKEPNYYIKERNKTRNHDGELSRFSWLVSVNLPRYEDDDTLWYACTGSVLSANKVLIGDDCFRKPFNISDLKRGRVRSGSRYFSKEGILHEIAVNFSSKDLGAPYDTLYILFVHPPFKHVKSLQLNSGVDWTKGIEVGWGGNKIAHADILKYDPFHYEIWYAKEEYCCKGIKLCKDCGKAPFIPCSLKAVLQDHLKLHESKVNGRPLVTEDPVDTTLLGIQWNFANTIDESITFIDLSYVEFRKWANDPENYKPAEYKQETPKNFIWRKNYFNTCLEKQRDEYLAARYFKEQQSIKNEESVRTANELPEIFENVTERSDDTRNKTIRRVKKSSETLKWNLEEFGALPTIRTAGGIYIDRNTTIRPTTSSTISTKDSYNDDITHTAKKSVDRGPISFETIESTLLQWSEGINVNADAVANVDKIGVDTTHIIEKSVTEILPSFDPASSLFTTTSSERTKFGYEANMKTTKTGVVYSRIFDSAEPIYTASNGMNEDNLAIKDTTIDSLHYVDLKTTGKSFTSKLSSSFEFTSEAQSALNVKTEAIEKGTPSIDKVSTGAMHSNETERSERSTGFEFSYTAPVIANEADKVAIEARSGIDEFGDNMSNEEDSVTIRSTSIDKIFSEGTDTTEEVGSFEFAPTNITTFTVLRETEVASEKLSKAEFASTNAIISSKQTSFETRDTVPGEFEVTEKFGSSEFAPTDPVMSRKDIGIDTNDTLEPTNLPEISWKILEMNGDDSLTTKDKSMHTMPSMESEFTEKSENYEFFHTILTTSTEGTKAGSAVTEKVSRSELKTSKEIIEVNSDDGVPSEDMGTLSIPSVEFEKSGNHELASHEETESNTGATTVATTGGDRHDTLDYIDIKVYNAFEFSHTITTSDEETKVGGEVTEEFNAYDFASNNILTSREKTEYNTESSTVAGDITDTEIETTSKLYIPESTETLETSSETIELNGDNGIPTRDITIYTAEYETLKKSRSYKSSNTTLVISNEETDDEVVSSNRTSSITSRKFELAKKFGVFEFTSTNAKTSSKGTEFNTESSDGTSSTDSMPSEEFEITEKLNDLKSSTMMQMSNENNGFTEQDTTISDRSESTSASTESTDVDMPSTPTIGEIFDSILLSLNDTNELDASTEYEAHISSGGDTEGTIRATEKTSEGTFSTSDTISTTSFISNYRSALINDDNVNAGIKLTRAVSTVKVGINDKYDSGILFIKEAGKPYVNTEINSLETHVESDIHHGLETVYNDDFNTESRAAPSTDLEIGTLSSYTASRNESKSISHDVVTDTDSNLFEVNRSSEFDGSIESSVFAAETSDEKTRSMRNIGIEIHSDIKHRPDTEFSDASRNSSGSNSSKIMIGENPGIIKEVVSSTVTDMGGDIVLRTDNSTVDDARDKEIKV